MVSIIEYWKEISTAIGGIVLFITGRKSAKFTEQQQHAGAVSTMQKTYDVFLEHYNKQHTTIVAQYNEVLEDNKKIVVKLNKLQDQFITLQLAYAKEVENSQNWEKLHKELENKYRDLESKYEGLSKSYEKLKTEFDKYKKQPKNESIK